MDSSQYIAGFAVFGSQRREGTSRHRDEEMQLQKRVR